jgi:hypothetical protein
MKQTGRKRQTAQPPTTGPNLLARKRLADMTPQEKAAWAQARYEGLAAFVAEARRYRSRRTWPGSENGGRTQNWRHALTEGMSC